MASFRYPKICMWHKLLVCLAPILIAFEALGRTGYSPIFSMKWKSFRQQNDCDLCGIFNLKDTTAVKCDQIGRFLKVLCWKFSCKSSQSIWWLFGQFWNTWLALIYAVTTFWATFGNIGTIFIRKSGHTAALSSSLSFVVMKHFLDELVLSIAKKWDDATPLLERESYCRSSYLCTYITTYCMFIIKGVSHRDSIALNAPVANLIKPLRA